MANERTVPYDIKRLYLCTFDGVSTFGTATRIKGAVSGGGTFRMKTGEQPGDGAIYSVVSKIIAATINLQFADLQAFESLQIILNNTPASSGSPQGLESPITSKALGYFSLLAITDLDDGVGEFHLFFPQVKLTSDFGLTIADAQFSLSEFQGTAIPCPAFTRDDLEVIGFLIRYAVAVTPAIPPAALPLIA